MEQPNAYEIPLYLPITIEEIRRAIHMAKNNKEPVPDDLCGEILKLIDEDKFWKRYSTTSTQQEYIMKNG